MWTPGVSNPITFPISVDSPTMPGGQGDDGTAEQWANWFKEFGKDWFTNWFNGVTKGPIGALIEWLKSQFGSNEDDVSYIQHIVNDETGSGSSSGSEDNSFINSDNPGDYLKLIAEETNDPAWFEKYTDFLIDKYFMDANNEYNTEMSNTAFSRLINDIKTTGYNPWLAFQSGFGQASSPTSSGSSSGINASSQGTSRANNSDDNVTSIIRSIVSLLGFMLLKK